MSRSISILAVLLLLSACGTALMSQEGWVSEMRATYPPGTPEADVEASVTSAGMTMIEAPEAFRTLPRSVTGDGSGYWRRVSMVENTAGCDMRRNVYMRFDDQGQLLTVYSGDAACI